MAVPLVLSFLNFMLAVAMSIVLLPLFTVVSIVVSLVSEVSWVISRHSKSRLGTK